MFSHDHRLNPKIDYREFIPFLLAATSSKGIIESDVMFKGVLPDTFDELKEKAPDKLKDQPENKAEEITTLMAKTPTSKTIGTEKSTLLKADFCHRLCFMRSGDPMSWSERS